MAQPETYYRKIFEHDLEEQIDPEVIKVKANNFISDYVNQIKSLFNVASSSSNR